MRDALHCAASLAALALTLPLPPKARAATALPRPRITGISHAAFYVSDMAKARAFYEGFLGYQSPFCIPRKDPGQQLVWIKINDRQSVELFPGSEVPLDADRLYHIAVETDDAEDYVEFMLYEKYPSTDRLRTMHHICVEVPDAGPAGEILKGRPYPAGSKPPTPMKEGVNGKRQINYYDPDGTRVEVMEPDTFDRKPWPPSGAPPPASEPKPAGDR